MKPQNYSFNNRSITMASVLTASVLLAFSCSKNAAGVPPPDPENEYMVYMSDDSRVIESYSVCSSNNAIDENRTFDVSIFLWEYYDFLTAFNSQFENTKLIAEPFTPARITRIDVIALKDYNSSYPEGSLLNDLVELRYHPEAKAVAPELTMDMTRYFEDGNTISWNNKFVCRLDFRTPPDRENVAYGPVEDIPGIIEGIKQWQFPVSVKIYLETGTTLQIYPRPTERYGN